MNKNKSLLVSAVAHIVIILLSIFFGLIARSRMLPPAPIRVDLRAPDTEVSQPGPPKTVDKKKEPKPDIIKRDKPEPKPDYDPDADLARLEELLKKSKLENEKPVDIPEPVDTSGNEGGGVYGGSSAYDSMIQQIIRNNWVQPSRAVLGANPPIVLVTIRVEKNGKILSSRITKSSDNQQLDSSVLRAIEDSNPLPKFPPYMAGSPKDIELRFIVED